MTEVKTQLEKDEKYAIGRKPENTKNLEWGEFYAHFSSLDGLEPQKFRSDRERQLRNLEGFKHLAWTPRVRHLYYNEEKEIMVKDVEGDLYLWVEPSEETIEKQVQEYPKAEVSLGEKYDSRFERGDENGK